MIRIREYNDKHLGILYLIMSIVSMISVLFYHISLNLRNLFFSYKDLKTDDYRTILDKYFCNVVLKLIKRSRKISFL